MNGSPDRRAAIEIHRRLETHVAAALALLVMFALGVALFIAARIVTTGALDRASNDLTAAQSAFYLLQDDRAGFAAAQTALVTTLPVFRSYMTDTRLTADIATMQGMADQYRHELKAAFCIVNARSGKRLATSGWPEGVSVPDSIDRLIAGAVGGQSQQTITNVGNGLFLVVSEPARFSEETLGALTVAYPLDDAAALRLANLTHGQVNLFADRRLTASSLIGPERQALADLVATDESLVPGRAPRMQRLGDATYIVAAFALSPDPRSAGTGRLVLLQDWAPTQRYLNQLQRGLLAAGIAIFAVSLAGGVLFARRVSRPLKDIAAAARDVASGNWTRSVPVHGTVEALETARAFNEMTTGLLHWYDHAKKRDDDLRQSQKMEALGRLAAGIAHDFNNLLTAITGYGELVMMRMGESDPGREDVEEIINAADRAAALIRQLLRFGRREAVTPSALELHQVIIGIEPMLHRVVSENIELVTSIEPGTGHVFADRGQMEQVLLNLVINARDAMPNGGTLRIGLATSVVAAGSRDVLHVPTPRPYVCLSVADTGRGMDEQTAARIFEPFFTTKEAGRGTGLGLAIVYSIVQEAGGMMDLETAVGRGTTFRLYLPQMDADQEAELPADARPAAELFAGGSETVLLAEDDNGLNVLIAKALREAGYTVLPASDGTESLEIARAHGEPIHLLLADLIMPGLNGRALFDSVTSLRPETRVCFMSGYSEDVVAQHGIQIAGAHFIGKPFSMDVLLVAVREAIDGPRVQLDATKG